MQEFLGITLNAVLVAGLYATMSYGLALIYGVMKIINLAHAGVMMLAAYVTFALYTGTGLDPFLSVAVVFPLFFGLGVLLHRFVVRRLPQSGNTPAIQSLLLLFGVWLVLQNVAYWIWTGETRSILTGYTMTSVDLFGVKLGVPMLLVFAIGAASLVVLNLMLTRTYLGKAIRAVTQNRAAAMLVGVNADRIAAAAFGLGTAFAALAGSMMSTLYAFTPDFGRNFLLKAFCIIVLGGMESFTGVAMGALALALFESYVVSFNLVSNVFQDAITFGLLVVVLVVLPGGLPGLLPAFARKGVTR